MNFTMRKYFSLIIFIIILVAIPATIFLARQQQILRSRALEANPLTFSPADTTQNLSSTFDITVQLRAGSSDVSAVDFILNFNREILEMVAFTPSAVYQAVINGPPDNIAGSFRYVGVNPTATPVTGNINIGLARFRAKAVGTSPLGISNALIAVSGETTGTSYANTSAGNVTITEGVSQRNQLLFSPNSLTKQVNEEFDVTLTISNPDNLDISGVDFRLEFSKDILEIRNFTPSSVLNSVLINGPPDNIAGSFRYVAVNTTSTPITQNLTLGVLKLKGKAVGQGQVGLTSGSVTASGQSSSLSLTSSGGSYTIGVVPSPTPSPSPTPTPVVVSCSRFELTGLTSTGTNERGGPIYNVPATGDNRLINLQFTPTGATITLTPIPPSGITENITINEVSTGVTIFRTAQIPPNTTASSRTYNITGSIPSGATSVSCLPIRVVVAGTTPDVICPATTVSTEVKFRNPDGSGSWTTQSIITANQTVKVAGFHNNQTPASLPTDIELSVTGPSGFSDMISQGGIFTPPADLPAGVYTFVAKTKNASGVLLVGPNCISGASTGRLTVNAAPTPTTAPVLTTRFKIAESRSALAQANFQAYTGDPMEITHSFADKTPGVKRICVQFEGSNGALSTPLCKEIELVSLPSVSACNLNVSGVNVDFEITGLNLGVSGAGSKVKSGTKELEVKEWTNDKIVAKFTNAPSGQVFPITLTTTSGLIASGICSSLSQLSLGASLFCPQVTKPTIRDVELTIVEARTGVTPVREIVSLDSKGIVSGLQTRFVSGAGYRVAIKVPKSIRRTVEFIASAGTNNVNLSTVKVNKLPLGDIFPVDNGDGAINAHDRGELVREWAITAEATGRSGDLNGDGRVNSIDWSCMRQDFGLSDDDLPRGEPLRTNTLSIPVSPVATASATPSTTPSPTSTPTPTPTPTPSPSPGT